MKWNGIIDFSTSCTGPQTNTEGNLRNAVVHKGSTFPSGTSIPQPGQLFFYTGTSSLSTPPNTMYQYTGSSWAFFLSKPGAESRYVGSFDDTDLVAGILTVVHDLNVKEVQVCIYDNNDKLVIPNEVTLIDVSSLTVDLTDASPITGTWTVLVK